MGELATWLTTLGVCALSAIVPLVNAELYLVAASAVAQRNLVVPLIVAAAVGQMAGKLVMYFAGRGAMQLPNERLRRAVSAVEARFRERAALGDTLILASSFLGIPPFYLVSVACGMFRVNVFRFAAIGLAGRLARFTLIVLAPQFVKGWWGAS